MAAALSFDSAYRQVKRGQLAPVYYLTGDEDVLKQELVDLILECAVEEGGRDFNVDVRAAGDLDGEALHVLVETPPLMAARRAVVVRGLEQWRRNAKVWQVLERYLRQPSPTTVLVLVLGSGATPDRSLVRAATHVEVAPLRPDRVGRWVSARAKRVGLDLTREAVEHLVDAVGSELGTLGMEIDKLAAAADSERALSAADVAPFVGVRHGETPHDWVTAVIERDVPRGVRLLGPLLAASGVTAVRLLGVLGGALIGVRLAAALLEGGASSREAERAVLGAIRAARPPGLRDWKDEAGAWVRAARRWSTAELDAAIRAAYDADRALKSTTVSDDRGILSAMVLGLARECQAA